MADVFKNLALLALVSLMAGAGFAAVGEVTEYLKYRDEIARLPVEGQTIGWDALEPEPCR